MEHVLPENDIVAQPATTIQCLIKTNDRHPLPVACNEELTVGQALVIARQHFLGVDALLEPQLYCLRLIDPANSGVSKPWHHERVIPSQEPPLLFELYVHEADIVQWDVAANNFYCGAKFACDLSFERYDAAPLNEYAFGEDNHKLIMEHAEVCTVWIWKDDFELMKDFKRIGYICPNTEHRSTGRPRTVRKCCSFINGQWRLSNVYLARKKTACCHEMLYRCKKERSEGLWVEFSVQTQEPDISNDLVDELDLSSQSDEPDDQFDRRKTLADFPRLLVGGGGKVFGLSTHRKILQTDEGVIIYLWKTKDQNDHLKGLQSNGRLCSSASHVKSTTTVRFEAVFPSGGKWYQQSTVFATRVFKSQCCHDVWYKYKRLEECRNWVPFKITRDSQYMLMKELGKFYPTLRARPFVEPHIVSLVENEIVDSNAIFESCFHEEHCSILLGNGGIGKTEMCLNLASTWAAKDTLSSLVIYVPLCSRDWMPQTLAEQNSSKLREWISAYWQAKNILNGVNGVKDIKRLLKTLCEGHIKVLWIFDGVKKGAPIPQELLSEANRATLGLKYVLFTGPISARLDHEELTSLDGWHLQGLVTEQQHTDFVSTLEPPINCKSVLQWIASHKAQDLCNSPLLLRVLCSAYVQSRTQDNPLSRRTADVLTFVFTGALQHATDELSIPSKWIQLSNMAFDTYCCGKRLNSVDVRALEDTGFVCTSLNGAKSQWVCKRIEVFFAAVAIAERITPESFNGWRKQFSVTVHAQLWHLVGGLLVSRPGKEWYAVRLLDIDSESDGTD